MIMQLLVRMKSYVFDKCMKIKECLCLFFSRRPENFNYPGGNCLHLDCSRTRQSHKDRKHHAKTQTYVSWVAKSQLCELLCVNLYLPTVLG